MPEPIINEDELVGFIMKRAYHLEGLRLDYEDVRAVLDAELNFLEKKGIAEPSEAESDYYNPETDSPTVG